MTTLCLGTDGVTSLEGEIGLHIVDWREVVILCLAKLQETKFSLAWFQMNENVHKIVSQYSNGTQLICIKMSEHS